MKEIQFSTPRGFQKKPLESLEKLLLRDLQQKKLEGSSLLLAVSGGLDSMVLLESFWRLKPLIKWQNLSCAYIDHGPSENLKQERYRRQAWSFVKGEAEKRGFTFYSNVEWRRVSRKWEREFVMSETLPQIRRGDVGEEKLRNYRFQCLFRMATLFKLSHLVLAHHGDDQLETQLIRLFRGTGVQGLKGIREQNQKLLRPFLTFDRETIETYARQKNLRWLEDPSNRENLALRNWIRNRWLTLAEQKRPGARQQLRRSFAKILDELEHREWDFNEEQVIKSGLSRDFWRQCGVPTQARLLVWYLSLIGSSKYSERQVYEVIKRLDTPQRQLKFHLAGLDWIASERWIKGQRRKTEKA